jgi:hypothetical protein
MTIIPNKPKATGKVLAPEKFPISKTAASTIKIVPTNSAIFWNIILHMLISTHTLYRLSLERLSLCHNWRKWQENRFAPLILARAVLLKIFNRFLTMHVHL